MDLVYIVKTSAPIESYNELRFSIRSMERNLVFENLVIVGGIPSFLKNIKRLPVPDSEGHKYPNVAKKILRLLEYENITEDFIYCNDDFFLLKYYGFVPYLHKGLLRNWIENYPFRKGIYYEQIVDVYEKFPNGKFFEVHFPIVFNKANLWKIIKKYGMAEKKIMVMLRTYYCNELGIDGEETRDYKIYNISQLEEYKNAPFISTTDQTAMSSEFKTFIYNRFPQKSKFEY